MLAVDVPTASIWPSGEYWQEYSLTRDTRSLSRTYRSSQTPAWISSFRQISTRPSCKQQASTSCLKVGLKTLQHIFPLHLLLKTVTTSRFLLRKMHSCSLDVDTAMYWPSGENSQQVTNPQKSVTSRRTTLASICIDLTFHKINSFVSRILWKSKEAALTMCLASGENLQESAWPVMPGAARLKFLDSIRKSTAVIPVSLDKCKLPSSGICEKSNQFSVPRDIAFLRMESNDFLRARTRVDIKHSQMADSYDRAKRPTRSWSRAGDKNRFIVRCKHAAVNLFVTIRTFSFFFACSQQQNRDGGVVQWWSEGNWRKLSLYSSMAVLVDAEKREVRVYRSSFGFVTLSTYYPFNICEVISTLILLLLLPHCASKLLSTWKIWLPFDRNRTNVLFKETKTWRLLKGNSAVRGYRLLIWRKPHENIGTEGVQVRRG